MQIIKYIIFLFFGFIFSGCSTSEKEEITIGFSQCLSDDAWRQVMNSEVFTEANLLDDKNINVLYRSANGNNQKQIEQIEELIAQDVDVLIVSPNEAAPLTDVVSRTYKKGIPVIVVDRNINSNDFTAFIGGNNFEVGISAGTMALNKLEQRGIDTARILQVTGLPGSSPAEQRLNGFNQNINNNSTHVVDILKADWHKQTAYRKLDSLFKSSNVDYDLIFAHNDEMAHAAYLVTRKYSKNPLILGVDGLITTNGGVPMILEKQIDGTISYPTGGDLAVRTALNALAGNKVDKYNYLNTLPIDSRNAETLFYEGIRLQEQKEKLRNLIERNDDLNLNIEKQTNVISLSLVLILLLLLISGVIFYFFYHKNRANKLLLEKQQVIDNQNQYIRQQRDHLLTAVRKMEELTEVKTNFFTNISHEFKTLLTVLKLDIDKLNSTDSTVHHLRNNVTKLTKTLNQLLHFQKVENPDYPVSFEYGNISHLINEIAENLRPTAESKGLSLEVNTPHIHCEFDRDIMDKILTNIVHNAIKYTEKGKVKIELFKEEDLVKIKVTDTGIGIPENEKSKIFERFEHSSISDFSEDSSGIGLDFSMNLILMHEGNIGVESVEGEGSVFTITIPLRQKPVKTIDVSETIENAGNLKQKILVVEDTQQIRERIKDILRGEYKVIEAVDGLDGYEKACYHNPDLIISDLLMPNMDGIEFSQKVFSNPVTMGIPLILLSAVSSDESIIRGYKIGADDYITKPFNPETLKARVRNLLEKRSASQGKAPIDALESTGDKDSAFLNEIKEIVFENITNQDFKIDEVVKKVGMSRSKFYRKVKDVTGLSPVNYLRKIKLEYASQVILKSDNTISEVAYLSGFSDVKYFTKCFLKEFKIYPSEYRKKFQ